MNEIINLFNESKSYLYYYKQAVNFFSDFNYPSSFNNEEQHKILSNPHFQTLIGSFPGIIGIIDFYYHNYIFLSENIKSIWGYNPEEFYENGLAKTITLFPDVHNEIIVKNIFPTMFSYIDKYSETGDAKNLRVSYNTLIKRKDGSIGAYLHQINVIHIESKKPSLVMKLVTDISHVKKDNNITMNICKKNEKGIYQTLFTKNFTIDPGMELLSSREIEVLSLIGQGKTSAEVGELLNISENTVYKHRKNMLKKMDTKNTGELLSKAITNGLI